MRTIYEVFSFQFQSRWLWFTCFSKLNGHASRKPWFCSRSRRKEFVYCTVLFFADSGSESGSHKGGGGGARKSNASGGDGKPTRVRTVLNEKQLHTLRTCYAANPRPDALMKEQLVEMTGLSPRVIRVWFQNKRCKDKKKTLLIKQQMQQEKVGWFIRPSSFVFFLFWFLLMFSWRTSTKKKSITRGV